MDNYSNFKSFISSPKYADAPWSELQDGKPMLESGSIHNYMSWVRSSSRILFNDEDELGRIDGDDQLETYFHLLIEKLKSSNLVPETKKNIICSYGIYVEFLYFHRTGSFRESPLIVSTEIKNPHFQKKTAKPKSDKVPEPLIAQASCSIFTLEYAVLELLRKYPHGLSTNQIDKCLDIQSAEVIAFISKRLEARKLVNNNGNENTPVWRRV